MMFSKELQQMLETKKGYRNEGYSGSGERDVAKVLKFELYELGNEDILDFFKEHYNLTVTFEDYQDGLREEIITEADVDAMIEDMLAILHQKFGHDELSCIWLTTYEGVKANYIDEGEYLDIEEEMVSEYNFSNANVLPISDLEDQGSLFVMDIHSDFLPVENVCLAEKEGLFPWLLSKEEFEERAIPSKEATKLVQENRAGTKYSKNKGEQHQESPTGDLVEIYLPIEAFSKEYLDYIAETVDDERVESYQFQFINTPIYALLNARENWVISDGGHRLMANVLNEKRYIRALVPVTAYSWFESFAELNIA